MFKRVPQGDASGSGKSTPVFYWKGELMKLKKKILPVLLSSLFACSSIAGGYLSATAVPVQAAATATYGLMEVIEAIFASFGVSYMTYDMFGHFTDGNNALQPDWQNIYDSMEDSYEKQWAVINGGGGKDPTPTPDPDIETPPHFSEIVKTAMASGVLELGKESYGMIKTWMDTNMTASYEIGQLLCDKTMPDGMNVDPAYIKGGNVVGIFHYPKQWGWSNHPDGSTDTAPSTDMLVHADKYFCYLQMDNKLYFCEISGFTDTFAEYFYQGEYIGYKPTYGGTVSSLGRQIGGYKVYRLAVSQFNGVSPEKCSTILNAPIFSSADAAWNYLNQQYANYGNDDEKVQAPIWVSPELQNTYKNAGKLEFPENAPQSINVPNIDQLAQLAQQLQNASSLDTGSQTDAATSAMQKYLASLQTKTNPDPGTSPKPEPDPKPSVTPTPDKSDSGDTGSNNDKESFTADLKELFPFCIPFDLIHALKILSADPETPYFEVPVKIHSFGIDVDYTFVLDFEQFNMIAKVLRTVETLGFIVLLIWVTRDLIKG